MKKNIRSVPKLLIIVSVLMTAHYRVSSQSPIPALAFPNSVDTNSDSLNGFDEEGLWQEFNSRGIDPNESNSHIGHLKKQFIRARNFPSPVPAAQLSPKFTNTTAVLNSSPCVNEGFESTPAGTYTSSGSVNGWTLSSSLRNSNCVSPAQTWTAGSQDFSIHSTPIINIPGIGTLSHSPLGGTKVAQLNDFAYSDYSVTKLSQTFPVTSSNSVMRYAFAAVLNESVGHQCCEQPGFNVFVKDCSGQVTACLSQSINPTYTCSSFPTTFSYSASSYWTNWQIRLIDLSLFIGSCVTIEFVAFDCSFGGHYGSVFLDTECTTANTLPCVNCTQLNPINPVSYCPGGPALIQAPAGFATYQWVSPSTGTLNAPNPTLTAITVTNPVPGNVYTVNLNAYSGCQFVATYTLATTQISVGSVGTAGTCSLGSNGSASVYATGSGSGYNYVWINSSNSVVATASVANNLPIGNYTVMITAQTNSSCGTAAATVNIGIQAPATQFYAKPFCSSVALLNTPPGSGHKWYSGTSLVSTNASYTVTSPLTGQVYRVGFQNQQGCRDSIVYTLQASAQGSVAVVQNPLSCQGSSNGNAVITLTPAGNPVPGVTSTYSVYSVGTTPAFSFSAALSGIGTVTVTGLSAGGTYSIVAFDGSCFASANFSKSVFTDVNTFSVTSIFSPTICQGSSVPLNVISSNTIVPGQYTYSWSPPSGLSSFTAPNVLATPSIAPGSYSVITYSVAITPSAINCPVTKTIAILISHPAAGVITSPGIVCTNYSPMQLTATPVGGTFLATTGSGLNSSGLLTPSAASPGAYSFTYQTSLNSCIAKAVSSYTILPGPSLAVSGNTNICSGETTTLSAAGAQIYFWPGFGNSDHIVVSPASTTSYVVTGSSGNGCNASHMAIVLVTPQPSLTISGDMQICAGESAVLTASGADNFAWSNNVLSAQNTVSPLSTTAFSVLGINLPGNCTHTQVVTVTVHPLPVVTISGKNTVCSGDLLQLTASGAQSYEWDGIPGAAAFTAIIQSNTIIAVKGIDQNGCTHSNTVAVVVEDCTGLVKGGTEQGIAVYPNPFLTHLNVAVSVVSEVSVYDALGKLLLRKQLFRGDHQIDMRSFSSGVYYLQVENPSGTQVQKLMKVQKLE